MDLPLFHLYGDPPDSRAFNFVHAETIASRCALHDWRIGVHRHANLVQILVIESGSGEVQHEMSTANFSAPAIIIVPPTLAHGFRFQPSTRGWVVTFTEDVGRAFGDSLGETITSLKRRAVGPAVPIGNVKEIARLSELCGYLIEERFLSREGYQTAMNSYLALIAIELKRLLANHDVSKADHDDAVMDRLFELIERHFRSHRSLRFYAARLAMSPDRLNKHVKLMTGVTAGQLIRRRLLTEAKRQLAFSDQPITDIAYDLAYADPSHFVRSFRRDTGVTPRVFREAAGRLT